jgi:hypothetical protein
MTALALDPAIGKFTITKENLSSLKLDGYTKGSDNSDVAAEDTLAEALSKLQTQINDEENARAKAIRDLLGGEEINAAFDTIKEISDWLAGNDSGADGIIDAIATLTGEEDVDGSVKQQIKAVVDTLGTAASKNEEDFATSDVLETTTFDYIVPTAHIMPAEGEEIEGEEPDPNGADDLLQNEEEVVVTKQTIAWLFNKVAELEARIQVLEAEKVSSDEETSE